METEESKNEVKEDTTESKESKKELRQKLRQQMEFYFSDSNLTKDRFLKKEVTNSADGFIDLNVFMKFNKIRQLTEGPKQLIKALRHSDHLELNENETMIRRKETFVEPTQHHVDKRTIYVEDLPAKATNETVRAHFEQFGQVSYISMPKFKTTNQLKGFAFIEFNEKESAKNAIKFYQEQFGKEYDLANIGKFPKFNAQIIELEKKIAKVKSQISEHETNLNEQETSKERKRKTVQDDGNGDEPVNKESKKSNSQANVNEWSNCKVISKKSWLKLKEDFLNRQKEEIKQLKDNLNELNEKLKKLEEKPAEIESKSSTAETQSKGCIFKIVLDLNNEEHFKMTKMSRQQLKENVIKQQFLDSIAYVDIEKNSNLIHIRCKTAQTAQELVQNEQFLPDFDKRLLENDEESLYLAKIDSSRNKKQEKKDRKTNKQNKPATRETQNFKKNPPKKVENASKLTTKSPTKTIPNNKKHITFDE